MKSQTQEGEAQEYKLLFYSHSKILLPGNSGVAFIDFRAIEVFFFFIRTDSWTMKIATKFK